MSLRALWGAGQMMGLRSLLWAAGLVCVCICVSAFARAGARLRLCAVRLLCWAWVWVLAHFQRGRALLLRAAWLDVLCCAMRGVGVGVGVGGRLPCGARGGPGVMHPSPTISAQLLDSWMGSATATSSSALLANVRTTRAVRVRMDWARCWVLASRDAPAAPLCIFGARWERARYFGWCAVVLFCFYFYFWRGVGVRGVGRWVRSLRLDWAWGVGPLGWAGVRALVPPTVHLRCPILRCVDGVFVLC